MKKAFTLVEMLIVLVIIGILLGLMSFFSVSYIIKLNIENDLESFENTFFQTQISSLSQIDFGKIKNASYVGVYIKPNKDYIEKIALTGNLNNIRPITTQIQSFSYIKVGTGFEIFSGNTFDHNLSKPAYFLYKPYSIGAIFIEDIGGGTYNILSGDYKIKIYTEKANKEKQCYFVDLNSGKITKDKCN